MRRKAVKYSEFLTSGAPDISGLDGSLAASKQFSSKNITAVQNFDSSMSGCFSEVNEIIDAIMLACKTNIEVKPETGKLNCPKEFLRNAVWMNALRKSLECTIYIDPSPNRLFKLWLSQKNTLTSFNIDNCIFALLSLQAPKGIYSLCIYWFFAKQ